MYERSFCKWPRKVKRENCNVIWDIGKIANFSQAMEDLPKMQRFLTLGFWDAYILWAFNSLLKNSYLSNFQILKYEFFLPNLS